MKHTLYHPLSLIFCNVLLSALFSCMHPQPEAPALLEQAQQLMEQHPDSAMRLIDSIFYPEESLRKPQYMDYLVTRVQARYKNYRPIAEDTLVFTARDYFVSKDKDLRRVTLACFYSGCLYREQENFDKAMQQYKCAERYAVKTGDVDLQGLVQYNIGDLLAEQGLHAQALGKYKTAESLYRQSHVNPEQKQAKCLATIGRMYLSTDKQDSSFVALHTGLELAETSGNRELQSLLAQNLSVAYTESEQYSKAVNYLYQSFTLNNDTSELPRYYLNFAKLYSQTGHTDSARLYTDKLKNTVETSDDLYFKVSAYAFLGSEAKVSGDFNAAFDYLQNRSLLAEEITEKSLEQSVYEVQQKYDFELLQNQHAQTVLRRQRISILLLILFLSASLAALVFQRKTVRQKNRLLSLQNAIETLNKTAKDLQKKQLSTQENKEQLRETLLWKFDVQHKAALLKSELQHLKRMDTDKVLAKFDEIVYGENNASQWNFLIETINEIHPGLSDFIRCQSTCFSDTEVNVCLLSYAGLSAKEVALILNQSPNTVNVTRSRIRKKMNLEEPRADFCAALEKAYRRNTGETGSNRGEASSDSL